MKKLSLISNFMTSQPGKKQLQYIYCPILTKRGNQTTKSGQLIEYSSMRNIFLQKSYTKCGKDTIPRPGFNS